MKTSKPQDTTLLDYLRSVRRNWPIVLITTIICALVALGVSLLLKRTYEAVSSVSVQDPNQALAITGTGNPTIDTPLQISSSHLPQVTRQAVVQQVQAKVRIDGDTLRRDVSASVDPNSALVDITADSGSASQAAAIANAFAQVDAALTTRETRQQYLLQAHALSQRLLAGPGAKDPATRSIDLAQLVRLQTLSSVATPVQVNTLARTPTAPSSPRPARNAAAAAIFGLLLGIGLAFARDALDRRLRQPAEVEELLAYPLIGMIGGDAFGCATVDSPPAENNHGAAVSGHSVEAFRAIRQTVRYLAADPLKVILVTSATPQEGKSTVAACLASAMAATGNRTLLVECDLRRPVLASRLGLAEQPGLTDYLTGNAQPSEIVQAPVNRSSGSDPGDAQAAHPGVACITAGTPAPRPTDLLASARFQGFLSGVAEAYDVVILDSAPMLTVADTLEIIPRVDGMLLCVRLRQATRDQARATHAALQRLPARPTGIIVTDAPEQDDLYYGAYGYTAAPVPAGQR